MRTPFVKMHGCGNDFVVLDERACTNVLDERACTNVLDERALGNIFDERAGQNVFDQRAPANKSGTPSPRLMPAQAAAIANRRTGIGCDQVIIIEPAQKGADVFMRIRNPDGTEAGACGNATRCVAHLLAEATGRRNMVIRTIAGDLTAEVLANGLIRVDMGPVRLNWRDVPLAHAMDTLTLDLKAGPVSGPAAVSMGNPHVTFFVPDIAAVPIAEVGPILEYDKLFPERANIGFVQVLSADRVRLRVWERGAGLTLACGSGACAAVVNAARRGLTGREVTVIVDGGELTIGWRDDNHVLMTGPVATSFFGEVNLAALTHRALADA
jgi:diaminopimelate epimerase